MPALLSLFATARGVPVVMTASQSRCVPCVGMGDQGRGDWQAGSGEVQGAGILLLFSNGKHPAIEKEHWQPQAFLPIHMLNQPQRKAGALGHFIAEDSEWGKTWNLLFSLTL